MKNKIIIGSAAVVFAALLWSLDGTFLRPHLFSLPSVLVVFIEHSLGFIALLPFIIIYRSELKRINKREWLTIFWVALFGGALGTTFFTKALFLTGFKDISAVILLQKFQPIFAIILAAIFLRERFPKRFYLYALLALVGGYFITFKDPWTIRSLSSAPATVALFSLLAAFSWGSSTTFGKYSVKNINYGLLAALRFGLTVIIMAVPALRYLGGIPSVSQLQWGIFTAIVFSSGAFSMYLYYYGLKKIPASLSALCELAWPFSAVFFDYFLNHNLLSASQFFGAAILLFSVIRVTKLTKPVTIKGAVLPGQNKGGAVGAKTANLDVGLAKNLAKGLYSCTAEIGGAKYPALLYHGINSLTGRDCLEAHLLNFAGDIYGKEITIITERYLRFPKKFESVELLAQQVQKDLRLAANI